ncbi:sugar transferase : Sugar transferase, PEP-CTERM system associated OS=Rhodopirellula sp. SWK7 GN=RRSWK_02665 PE=4 SV=1: Bac_transf [Gemmataceae bacterium]|nr:sugar transferase : Sugar transferase, PEP-CTERM system associated OS=Rhodopirellula sp. SWK7 GN=RRSWK_02665 PE=4 SV=1: Bac_transf [Gemmataceae bacterium]VTU01385.1 sugar transferase : Sugar transferase, PEP-CTERM system associated OS=Rhodopirellula sp. SWK7 GN=RRSWK_02665 PE=4 SV=1: Bac_transf [Gemmataceae bacterium]
MYQRTSRIAGLVTPRPVLRTPAPTTRRRPAPAPLAPTLPTRSAVGERAQAAADLVLAGAMAVVLLPVVLACVALVRLTSRGPAIYSQTRVGKNGRVFTLYKIRSMYHDCERHSGPKWSTPGDTRITPLGRVYRKLHLDELPQLWNVLRGDMSLIGPRPERPEIVAKLRESVPGYDRRHQVKPGITGFAQVHLPPDTCLRSVKNKVAYDLFYIRHASVPLALFILFATGLKLFGLKKLYQRKPRVPTE